MSTEWKPTIGIECHVQLATNTKLFSPANNDARAARANENLHEIDYGLPGMLPRLNREAVVLAVRAGAALGATIASESSFDRKHYFYPDLPKGYQTTQMYQPIILGGRVKAPLDDGTTVTVRIHHAHMEEDAGKLTHHAEYSLVDLNRAGTPLIEIVSEPDMHSPAEARAYATELYHLMTYAGVTRGDLYHGNMRFDVNVSVAKSGEQTLGTRTEIKNLNSFRSVERAAEYEITRQIEALNRGETIIQETRGWNDDTMQTTSQRSKEDAQDYRYMPDADIPPIVLSDEEIASIQAGVGTLPPAYRQKFATLGVDKSVIGRVLEHQMYAELISRVLDKNKSAARRAANWIASDLSADPSADVESIAAIDDVIELSGMVDTSELTSNAAAEIFNDLMHGAEAPRRIAEQKNLLQTSDESAITDIVDAVLADPASAKAIADIKSGNDKAIGYLVGQVMKQSRGQANPSMAQTIIRSRL